MMFSRLRGQIYPFSKTCSIVSGRFAKHLPTRIQSCQSVPISLRCLSGPSFVRHESLFPAKKSPILESAISNAVSKRSSSSSSPREYSATITKNGSKVVLNYGGNLQESYNATWLRQNCQCPDCVQHSSGQKTVDPIRTSDVYSVQSVQIIDDELILRWNEEDHLGRIPLSYLKEHSYSKDKLNKMRAEREPIVKKGTISKLPYDLIVNSEQGLWQWLKHLNEEGSCLLQGVPDETTVKEVVGRIWTLQPTIYGETFRVESTPDPINIAFSTEFLGYHMDLVYYESPPGYQFLLCKRFDDCIEGGMSLLVDSWYEAERLQRDDPELFNVLCRVPATFQKIHYARDRPVHMKYQRPHIVTNTNGQITNINWAPYFEGPLCVPEEDVEPYYRAYHKFAQMLENSDSTIKFRLQPGELLSFNNRRILHGRDGFKLNGGYRILEGCYLNIDETKSRTQVLSTKYNEGKPVKNVFNQSPS